MCNLEKTAAIKKEESVKKEESGNAITAGFDLSIQRDHLPWLELIAQVGAVKPEAFELGPGQPGRTDHELKQGHPLCLEKAGIPDFGHYSSHFPRPQIGQAAGVDAILVTERKVQEEIAYARDALLGQSLGPVGSNPLDEAQFATQSQRGHAAGNGSRLALDPDRGV